MNAFIKMAIVQRDNGSVHMMQKAHNLAPTPGIVRIWFLARLRESVQDRAALLSEVQRLRTALEAIKAEAGSHTVPAGPMDAGFGMVWKTARDILEDQS